MRDLTSSADAPGDALPMPPPVPLDLAKLAWTKDDFSDRCAGVRRLCADGNYDAGGGESDTNVRTIAECNRLG
jgi:hypothetical protein